MATERQVQYEFKVIVRVDENAWPHEVSDAIRDDISYATDLRGVFREVVSVEQVHDNW